LKSGRGIFTRQHSTLAWSSFFLAEDPQSGPCGLVQHWLMLRGRPLDKTLGEMMPTH
jgi:hypothetical protein